MRRAASSSGPARVVSELGGGTIFVNQLVTTAQLRTYLLGAPFKAHASNEG